MSNSALVDYTRLSPNRSHPRNHTIDKITIHHMAGNLSVETCGSVFANSSREASANYGIGSDGRVGLYVDEATVHGRLRLPATTTEPSTSRWPTAPQAATGRCLPLPTTS